MKRFLFPFTLLVIALAASFVAAQSGQGRGRGGLSVERMMEYDTDKDGRLSESELPERLAARIFEAADTNKDGFLDKAEVEKFVSERGGRGQGARGRGGQGGGGGEVSFDRSMSAIGRAMRGLSRSEKNAESREEDLGRVSALQMGLIGAKNRVETVKMSEAGQARHGADAAAYQTAFRLELVAALEESIELERAILAGRADAAKASLKRLAKVRDSGHDVFQAEHEEGDDDD